jgi:hypothetical protein
MHMPLNFMTFISEEPVGKKQTFSSQLGTSGKETAEIQADQ